jgi:hypothetical protein
MRSTTQAKLLTRAWKTRFFLLVFGALTQSPPLIAQSPKSLPLVQSPSTHQAATSSQTTVQKPVLPELPAAEPTELEWQPDYATAVQVAAESKKLVLIVFTDANSARSIVPAIEKQLADPKNARAVARHVLVKIPTNTKITVKGRESRLISHASFSELHGGPGLVVIDYANDKTAHHKLVVSQLPFASGKYYRFSTAHVPTLLTLPPGTLTQRSMVYAVRIHPENPQSCCGVNNPVLADEATSHSVHQAAIGVQGHHNWDSRFQRIRGRLAQLTGRSGMPREVVAESWPNQNLMDSCVDCVASWRHSPGHWGAVSAPQNEYAYDIRRGNNGIWYGTGIFSN